jgi:hypothetical protein
MLLKYACQNDYCFPGQERLATDMDVTRQSANTYVQELQRQQFIVVAPEKLDREWLLGLVHGCARVKAGAARHRAMRGGRP